ncbi:MAG TPA: alcohol dehydrogenase catalytic domain-containing protein [Chloroflexota bacterium]
MRAVVTRPGAGRAWLADIPEPSIADPHQVVVSMLRVGVCGTDRHVMSSGIGGTRSLPTGDDYLVIGHEAVGRVEQVGPAVQSMKAGDLVVPTVRRGCAACSACLANQADLCFTGRIRERGIVGLHGFLSERIVEHEEFLIRVPDDMAHVGPLVESLTTPEKALRRIGNARAHLPGGAIQRALVTGSGPIALLAVLALRLRGIPTWVLARQPRGGPAEAFAQACDATYVHLADIDIEQPRAALGDFDAIVEATGAVELGVAMLGALAPNGVLDLVGGVADRIAVPIQATTLGSMVGRNLTLLGSVNANTDDWRAAVVDLTAMRATFPGSVEGLITHTFGMHDVEVAFDRVAGQIKAVIDIDAG